MFTFNDVANFVIQNLSSASVNVSAVKDELHRLISERDINASDDVLTTIHLLRKAVLLSSLLIKNNPWVTLYDLKTAENWNVISTENITVPALQFKLPDAPLCYVNTGIVRFIKEVLEYNPDTEYRITFKPNFANDNYYTIVRLKKNKRIYSMALKYKLKAQYYKNIMLVYI
jgi:hypothetical protein